jgi:hypothetical protein
LTTIARLSRGHSGTCAALTAARWDESRLFQVATAYQAATDWHEQLPPLLSTVKEMS